MHKSLHCLVCAAAFSIFFCGCQKVINLSPDLPKVSEQPVVFRAPEQSTIRLAVSIGADDLRAIANQELPREFEGTDRPNIDNLTDEKVSWNLGRKDIKIDRIDANGITLTCPIAGEGHLEAKAALVPFSFTLDLSGTLVMRVAPELSETWTFKPNFEIIEFKPKVAEIPLKLGGATLATISVRDYVTDIVKDKKVQWSKKVNEAVVAKLDIKRDAKKAWLDLHQVAKVATVDDANAIGVWVSTVPKEIEFQKFDYSNNENVRSGLGIVAQIDSVISAAAPTSKRAEPLPELTVTSKLAEGFSIKLPVAIPFETLNQVVDSELESKTFSLGDKGSITIREAAISGTGDHILLEAKVDAKYQSFRASGTLYFLGKTSFDKAKQELRVVDLEYSVETRALLVKVAEWLIHETVARKIEQKLIVSLLDELERAKRSANEQLDGLIKKLPKDLVPTVELSDLQIDQIAVSHDKLVCVFLGKGKMSMKIQHP